MPKTSWRAAISFLAAIAWSRIAHTFPTPLSFYLKRKDSAVESCFSPTAQAWTSPRFHRYARSSGPPCPMRLPCEPNWLAKQNLQLLRVQQCWDDREMTSKYLNPLRILIGLGHRAESLQAKRSKNKRIAYARALLKNATFPL